MGQPIEVAELVAQAASASTPGEEPATPRLPWALQPQPQAEVQPAPQPQQLAAPQPQLSSEPQPPPEQQLQKLQPKGR